jgi:hypothetical protein
VKVVLFLIETKYTFCAHFSTWWAPARRTMCGFARQFKEQVSAFDRKGPCTSSVCSLENTGTLGVTIQ